jgi:N utilization substance protein A
VDVGRDRGIEGLDEETGGGAESRAVEALEAPRGRQSRASDAAWKSRSALAETARTSTKRDAGDAGKAGIIRWTTLPIWPADELIQKKAHRTRRRQAPGPEDKGGILAEYNLSEDQGNEIIMAARAHWFEDEPAEVADAGEGQ